MDTEAQPPSRVRAHRDAHRHEQTHGQRCGPEPAGLSVRAVTLRVDGLLLSAPLDVTMAAVRLVQEVVDGTEGHTRASVAPMRAQSPPSARRQMRAPAERQELDTLRDGRAPRCSGCGALTSAPTQTHRPPRLGGRVRRAPARLPHPDGWRGRDALRASAHVSHGERRPQASTSSSRLTSARIASRAGPR
jgi:hypothetical protein